MAYTYEECAEIASRYSVRKDFRANHDREHQWLRRNGLYDKACAHMEPIRRALTDEHIAKVALNYQNRRALKLADQSVYNAAIKRGILDQVCSHMKIIRRKLSDQELFDAAGQFTTRVEFAQKDHGAFQTASKRGILNEVCAHMDYRVTRRLSDEEILAIASQYPTRNDFKLGDFGAYVAAFRRNLIDAAFDHMEPGSTGFREDLPAVLYQFRLKTEGGNTYYKVGITNRKPRQRLATMQVKRGVESELINIERFALGRDARIEEKRLHKQFEEFRYDGAPLMKNGNTELFTIPLFGY